MSQDSKTVAEYLTSEEDEKLDINKWYLALSALTEEDIRIFFKRNRLILQRRVQPGLTLEQLGMIRDQLSGLAFMEAQFNQIKKEQKNS